MKNIVIIIFFALPLLMASCAQQSKTTGRALNNGCQLTRDKGGAPMLWGNCTSAAFLEPPFSSWYKQQNNYTVDSALCSRINMQPVKIDIFMGTWCGDSKREVPRMYKILEHCGVNEKNTRLFTVSNRDSFYKQTPAQEALAAGVFRVPTFIFYNEQGTELGRIIESPVQKLETDMQAIVGGTGYSPRYNHIHRLLQFCTQTNNAEFSRQLDSELSALKDSSYFSAAINNLVMVLMAGGKTERAGALSVAGEALFPNDIHALTCRARYLRFTGDASGAAGYSRKILEKDPENATAREILAGLNK